MPDENLEQDDGLESGASTEVSQDEPGSALDAVNAALDGMDPDAESFSAPKKPEEQQPKQPEAKDAAQPGKEEDPYKMPEGLGEKAQARFQSLVESNKEKDTKIEQMTAQVTDMQEAQTWLRENLLTDEQAAADLVGFADYRKALTSGDYQTAQAILQEQVNQLALISGQQLQADPLKDFPDLRQRVDGLELDMASAMEIAKARQFQGLQQQQAQRQQQSQQQQQEQQQMVEQTLSAVDALAVKWSQNDPDYPAKEAIIQQQLPRILKTVPLAQVPAQVEILYDSLAGVVSQQPKPNVRPLRPMGASGGNAVPQTSLEAVDQALGYR